ncbi:hypothetical protein COOONC_05839 [Cooperia oncophora]
MAAGRFNNILPQQPLQFIPNHLVANHLAPSPLVRQTLGGAGEFEIAEQFMRMHHPAVNDPSFNLANGHPAIFPPSGMENQVNINGNVHEGPVTVIDLCTPPRSKAENHERSKRSEPLVDQNSIELVATGSTGASSPDHRSKTASDPTEAKLSQIRKRLYCFEP